MTVIDGPREMSVYGDMMQFINCILIGGGGGCGARISSNGRSWVLLTVVWQTIKIAELLINGHFMPVIYIPLMMRLQM